MKLIDQQKILNTMIEFAHDGIILLDNRGVIIFVNPAASVICGFASENKNLQKSRRFNDLFEFYNINDNNEILENLPVSRALNGECVIDYKGKGITKKTGKTWYGLFSAIPIVDDQKIKGVVLSIKDISDSKMGFKGCEKDSEYCRSIISNMAEGLVIVDPEGNILEINPAAMRIYGFENLNEAVKNIHEYQDFFTIFDLKGNSLPLNDWPLSRALHGEAFSNIEVRIQRKKAGTGWIGNYSGVPVKDKTGKFILAILTIQDITARKHAEAALRQYEIYLSTIIEVAADGILAVDDEGRVIKANSRFAGLLEMPQTTIDKVSNDKNAILAATANQLTNPSAFIKKVRQINATGEVDTDVVTAKDGRYLEYYSAPIPLDGTIIGRVWSFKDITNRLKSEMELFEREKLLRLAFLIGSYGVYDFCIPSKKAKVNAEYETMLEYKPGEVEVTVDWWTNSIHPEDRKCAKSIFMDCMYGKIQDYKMEFRMRTKSGGWKWVLCQGKNIEYDKQCKPLRMLGTHIDITERKRAEDALREERDKLTKIAASVPGVICSYRERPDGSTHMPYASPAFLPIMGFKPENVANDMSQVLALAHPDDQKLIIESIAESKRKLTPWHIEYRYFHPHKGMVWIEGHSLPQHEADGSTVWHGFLTDITERKRSEEALRLSEEKFSKAFMTSPDSITISRFSDKKLIEINNGCLEVFGYTREEMIGHVVLPGDLNVWVNKEDRDRMEATLNASGEVNAFEALFRRKDGSIINGILSARIIKMNGIDYILAITRNITEQKKAEEARNRLTRELRALNSCDQVLVRVENEQALLDEICRIICDVAGYQFVWVGYMVNEVPPYVKVVAHAGIGEYFLKGENYPLNDIAETPLAMVIQRKQSCITQDFEEIPEGIVWRDNVLKSDYRSAIALPLLDESENVFGVLSIYSAEPNVFTFEEIKLLEELGGDLAFGIINLRSRIERKLAQRALFHEKELSDALIEASPGFFSILDRNGGVLRMNKNMIKMLGGRELLSFVYRDDLNLVTRDLKLLPEVGYLEEDIRFEFKSGEISWWRVSGHAVTIENTVYIITAGFDITQRKQVEENLHKALKEKEVLLQELYHRTKNNMQVISAFLAMQAIAVDDEKLKVIFNEMENRIGAMALVHEKLYKSKDLTNINLRDYLNDLTKLLFSGFPNVSGKVCCTVASPLRVLGFPNVSGKVTLNFYAEELFVTMDTAIPIGLVVTELITNSLKYAFPDARSGEILLRLQRHGQNELELFISDNGVSVPGTFDPEEKGTIGISTVLSIVRKQLRGSVELDTSHGFSWKILFWWNLYGKRV